MMNKEKNHDFFDRREFIKIITTAAFGGPALLKVAYSQTEGLTEAKERIHLNEQPTMTYRKLGRTGFMSSVWSSVAALP